MNNKKLSAISLLIFSLPTIPTVLLLAPLGAVLPAFYAEHADISLATIGIALILTRLFDAITDPLIGFLSDRTRTRFGPRKPWVLAGGILVMICAHNLFAPPTDAGMIYYLFWSACGYLAWTMIFIPYTAWASELSGDYHEKTRIFTYRGIVGAVGGLIFALSPLVLSPITGTTSMNGQVLELFAWALIVLTPICVGTMLIWGPNRDAIPQKKTASFKIFLNSLTSNRLMWRFMTVSILGGLALGIQISLSFLVLDNYLKIGQYFSYVAGVAMISSIFSLPIWMFVLKKFGKHKPWAIALMSQIVVLPVMLMLEPGESSFLPFLIIAAFTGFMGAGIPIIAPSVLSDLLDYQALKSDANLSGSYFSFLSFLGKSYLALSGGAGFYIISQFGYDAAKQTNDPTAVLALIYAFAGVPALLGIIGGLLLWRFPLTEKRQTIIRRRLESRAARAAPST